jgi:hypothetical protein
MDFAASEDMAADQQQTVDLRIVFVCATIGERVQETFHEVV